MLISKPLYSVGDILSFKITTGEELIARLVEEKPDGYVISKPLTLVPAPEGLALTQSVYSVDVKNYNITLNKNAVMMVGATRKEIADSYIQGTSGIAPASSMPGLKL